MPDLEYNINATVTGAEAVSDLKEDIDGLVESPAVTVDATGLQDAATASGDLATGLGDTATAAGDAEAPLESAGGIAGLFGDKLSLASIKAIGLAGAMNIIGQAIDLAKTAWEAYNAKQTVTDETTRSVSDALTDQAGALTLVRDRLSEIAGTEAATPVERLTSAIAEGLDPEELGKIVSALGVVGLTLEDLPPTLQAIEAGGDSALDTMEQFALQSGIPPEFARNIAEAVLASEDMSGIQDSLILSLGGSNSAVEELTDTYGTQIGALEQLNDAQQNIDLESIAADQLELARGADTATAALVAQAEVQVGPDATALDTWNAYVDIQVAATGAAEDQAAAAALQAQELEDAAAGAIAYNSALGSVDFRTTDIEGATTAFSDYTTRLFNAGNEAQAEEAAFDALRASVADTTFTMDVGTEAGRAQQDALEGVARVIDDDLARAYASANGDQAAYTEDATWLADQVLTRLQTELQLTDEQVAAVAETMGLTPEHIQTRFELAGMEEARLQLQLLGGAIEGLPASVETTVNAQIVAGDYVGALATIQAYYADPANAPAATVEVDADTAPATTAIADAANAGHPKATIVADADTVTAATDLLDTALEPRTATIVAHAHVAGAEIDLAALADAPRTAKIDVDALLADFESEMTFATRPRTVQVTVQATSVSTRFGSRWS